MPVKLTQEEAEARCLEHGYQWPKGFVYEGNKTKYPLICLTCGDNRPKRLNDVNTHGCKSCHLAAQWLTHDEVVAQGLNAKHPAQLLEPYKGNKVKHKYRFVDCGHEWEIRPHDLHNGQSCGKCRFDPGPTYVYLMEHDSLDAYKIGVTAVDQHPTRTRIQRLGYYGWDLVHKIEFATRKEALALEELIVAGWRAKRFPHGVTKEQLRSGYGETVSRKHVNKDDLLYSLDSWNTMSQGSEKDAGVVFA